MFTYVNFQAQVTAEEKLAASASIVIRFILYNARNGNMKEGPPL